MARDYLGALQVEPGDKLDYGVLGMKWGRRRSSAELQSDTAKRAASGAPVTQTKAAAKATTSDDREVAQFETSQAKYNRLRDQAKANGANSLDEADLKFVNARTEAIAKINKMNQQSPGWLSTTTKKVLQTASQKVMQEVTDSVAKKYITIPITKAITDNSAAVAAESKTPVDYVGKHRSKKK